MNKQNHEYDECNITLCIAGLEGKSLISKRLEHPQSYFFNTRILVSITKISCMQRPVRSIAPEIPSENVRNMKSVLFRIECLFQCFLKKHGFFEYGASLDGTKWCRFVPTGYRFVPTAWVWVKRRVTCLSENL